MAQYGVQRSSSSNFFCGGPRFHRQGEAQELLCGRVIPRVATEKLAGSLQNASFGIPGGSGLFSPIQVMLKVTRQWLRVTPDLTQCLQDWGGVIKHIGKHTTQVHQLANNLPHYIGYSDSCGIGMGGIWASGLNKIGPIMWHKSGHRR